LRAASSCSVRCCRVVGSVWSVMDAGSKWQLGVWTVDGRVGRKGKERATVRQAHVTAKQRTPV